jgi:hypothetical protein
MAVKKDIGDLYKNKFKDLDQEPPSQFIWEAIEMKNEEVRFYRFSWKNFNIYYLSSIVVFSILSLFTFTSTMLSMYSNNKRNSENKNRVQIDTIIISQQETSKIKSNDFYESEKITQGIKSSNGNNELITNEINKEQTNTDTSSLIHSFNNIKNIKDTSISTNITSSKKAKIRRVVVIEQRDTIVIVDTLHGKKNKKQRNK